MIGAGAILLKPYVVRDIQGVGKPAAEPAAGERFREGAPAHDPRPDPPGPESTLAGLDPGRTAGRAGRLGLPAPADRCLPRHLRADGPGHHHLSRPRPGGGRAPGDDPAGDRHAERPPRREDPLADDLRPVDRGGDVRGGRGELLGPAARQGEARRGHLARRRETRPRAAGDGLRRNLSLRTGLRRHPRPDGPAHAAGLGGHAAVAPLRGRGRRGELRRLPEAIHGDFQPGPTGALRPDAGRRHRRHPEQQHEFRGQRRVARQHVLRHPRQGLGADRGGDRLDFHQVDRRHPGLCPRHCRGGARLPAAHRHFQQGPPRRVDRRHRAHAPRREPFGSARPRQGGRRGTERVDLAARASAWRRSTIARSSSRARCTPWGTACCWASRWWCWCC